MRGNTIKVLFAFGLAAFALIAANLIDPGLDALYPGIPSLDRQEQEWRQHRNDAHQRLMEAEAAEADEEALDQLRQESLRIGREWIEHVREKEGR